MVASEHLTWEDMIQRVFQLRGVDLSKGTFRRMGLFSLERYRLKRQESSVSDYPGKGTAECNRRMCTEAKPGHLGENKLTDSIC